MSSTSTALPIFTIARRAAATLTLAATVRRSVAAWCFLACPALAQLTPEWISTVPVGTSLGSNIGGYVIDEGGVTYVTGTTGASWYIDIVTAAFGPNGTLLWQVTFDGPLNGFDQASAIALGPGGVLYVTGDTEGPGGFANVLLLKYEAATGTLLDSAIYDSGPGTFEYGGSVATDALGGVYVVGGTLGDGTDALVLKYDAACELQWTRTWDGAAVAPYSLDSGRLLRIDPNGDAIVLIYGVTASNQPDYVVVKYAPGTGETLWTATWGNNGYDEPWDLELDAGGDIYVTGVSGFSTFARFSTLRLRGSDGQLLWQAFDSLAYNDSVSGLALDGVGGVYVTGSIDPDTDQSNSNDNIWTVKRSTDGVLLWTHLYGGNAKWQWDAPSDVVADPAGHVFVGGYTNSPPYSADMITLVLDAASGAETDRHIIPGGPGLTADSGAMAFDGDFNLHDGGRVVNADTGAVSMSLVKFTTLASPTYRMILPQLVGGSSAAFAVAQAMPLQMQLIAFSVAGTASIPIPSLGVTLGLNNPQLLAVGTADASGSYSVSFHIPAGATGVTAWFQALQMNGATPVVKRTVQ